VRVVVTGGAGFIGANTCRALLAAPDVSDVVVLDDLSTGFAENLEGVPVKVVEGSILDPGAVDDAFAGADAVIHLAGRGSVPRSVEDPERTHAVNATGTLSVLEGARRAGDLHVVVASSSSVYGANPTLPKTEDLTAMPMSPYGASKLATEAYALTHQRTYGLPVLVFRFFNVYGPWQRPRHDYAAVVPAFVSAAFDGRPLPVHGDGRQSRDFTSVDTLADVLVDAVVRRVTSDWAVNLAFGVRTDLLDLVATLEDVLDRPLEVEHLPARVGDVRHTEADASLLRLLFPGVLARPMRDGLQATVDWYRTIAGD
jgi:UDP-glucose 4-epimerase